MLLQLLLACAIVALIVARIVDRRGKQQRQHHERLLIQALRLGAPEPSVSRIFGSSERRLEMELLLMALQSAGEVLGAALAAEARVGNNPGLDDFASTASLHDWVEARRTVTRAQFVYDDAAEAYHEFLETLPPPLRTGAAERGARLMAISYV
jgi:hypothetical protein